MVGTFSGLCQVLWQTWDEFWQQTSIGGANNAGKARKSYFRRAIWILIFGFFAYCTTMGVIPIVREYLEFPVTVTTSLKLSNKVRVKAYIQFYTC